MDVCGSSTVGSWPVFAPAGPDGLEQLLSTSTSPGSFAGPSEPFRIVTFTSVATVESLFGSFLYARRDEIVNAVAASTAGAFQRITRVSVPGAGTWGRLQETRTNPVFVVTVHDGSAGSSCTFVDAPGWKSGRHAGRPA